MGLIRTLACFLLLLPSAYGSNILWIHDPPVLATAGEARELRADASAPAIFDVRQGFAADDVPGTGAQQQRQPVTFRPEESRLGTERNFFRNLLDDQKAIWTSPSRVRANDARWLVPLGAATGGLIASDARAMQLERSRPVDISRSNNVANAGVAGLGALSLGMYALGKFNRNPHAAETGVLSAEALANSMIVGGFLKAVTLRDRPDTGDGRGDFFSSHKPLNASFPSEHAIAAWSMASVIAHEYPGWFTKVAVYGTATAVSIARVSGRKHFPSDVVVGSALGWLIGRQVYRAHHDPDLGGESIGTFLDDERTTIGSPYVPLDSWIYPALMRLAALGYIDTQTVGMQPWTRLECHRQAVEARSTLLGLDEQPAEIVRLIASLENEFAEEDRAMETGSLREIAVDSIYFRYTNISDTPLRDGFHFGRSIVNDFGRPFGEGSNVVTGFTAHAVDGRFTYFVRGEYQHAPAAPALPLDVRQFIAATDGVPLPAAHEFSAVNRARVLEAYVGATFGDFDFTFGKQSLWWGPGRMGAMVLSNNAEPMYMLRVSNTHPFRLPGPLEKLGDIRGEFFLGKLAGHDVPARPWLHGQKVVLRPTRNLELGFSRTVTFAGAGHAPFTLGTFGTSFFSVGDQKVGANQRGTDPGDRHAQFDLSYRVPFVRDWLTIYSDSYADDDPSPLAAPRRAAFNPGFYLSHFPRLPKLDLRVEAAYTDIPARKANGNFVYWNSVYRNGYTSDGNILGNWIGRQGKGVQGWMTWWFDPQRTLQVTYRNAKISRDFVPGGGTQHNGGVNAAFQLGKNLNLSGSVHYERWNFPLLAPREQSDWISAFQVTFFPRPLRWKRESR